MRAYIHAFQGFPWNEECEIAYCGFKNLGVECILFTSNEELDTRTREDIVVGGMFIMEHSLRLMGIDLPNYNYPEELEGFLGRRIWKISISDLKSEALPIFIKPLKEKAAKNFRFIADAYSAYPLAAQQFFLKYGEKFQFDITQVVGLTNDDAVSKEFRPFKQMIERLNRTYKVSAKSSGGSAFAHVTTPGTRAFAHENTPAL